MVGLLALGWLACRPAVDRPVEPRVVPEMAWPAWPAEGARLFVAAPYTPPRWSRRRVMIDPGHGEPDNEGNTSVVCEKEADEMLRIAAGVVPRLAATGAFAVRTTRPGGKKVRYGDRIAAADGWDAHALVSFHSDARAGDAYGPDPVTGCLRSTGAAGFSVLWSDEGAPGLVARRHALARAVADALVVAGFAAYGGEDYGDYAPDDGHPGVFVDRHAMDKRIRMLRRPVVPSVIVETHQALDPDEVARWKEPRTLEAFSAALHRALVAFAR